MINNFKLLESLLHFDNVGDFYFIQLIQRKKDNPEMKRNMNIINNYFVYDIEKYWELEERITHECIMHGTRAYLRLNVRNAKKVAMQTLKKVTDLIISEDYKAVKNAFLSAAGEFHSEEPTRWIVDIDFFEGQRVLQYLDNVINCIKNLQDKYINYNGSKSSSYKILLQLPTKNGVHIITNPFAINEFKQKFSDIEIHRDQPTILYIP